MAPTVNVALHLRLARILTGKPVAVEARLGPEAIECLAALDGLMVAIEERAELLRLPAAAEAVVPEIEVIVDEVAEVVYPTREDDAILPPGVELPESVPQAATPAEDPATVAPTLAMDQIVAPAVWGQIHDHLYEDILWLFKMGDNEGALNSLARLMDLSEGTEELQRFLTINQEKLFDLYHRLVGDPEAVVERQEGAVIGDRYFFQRAEVEALLETVNGATPISELLSSAGLSELKVYSHLHRIRREGLVQIHRSDA